MDSPIEFYRMAYASTLLSSVAYGAYALMAYGAIYLLLQRGYKRGRGEQLVLGYSIFMLGVTTAWYIAGARAKAYGFVDAIFDPDAVMQMSCSPAGVILAVMAAVQILCSDLLLLYRMYIMWSEVPLLVLLPGLAWLSSLVLAILICLECWTSEYGGPLQLPSPLVLHETFFPITVFINVFTSSAIAWKLWQHRRILKSGSGKSETVAAPMTVVGILCESAAVYAVVGVILAAFYAPQGPAVPLLSTLFQLLAFLSPAIIVLRVSLGMSYTRSSDYHTSSIRFHTQPQSGIFDGGSAASRSSLHFATRGRNTVPDPENLVLPGLANIPGDQRSTSSGTEVDGEAMSLGKVYSREL